MRACNNFEWFAAHTACIIVFRLSGRYFHLAEEPQERIRAETDGDWEWLSFVKIFLPVNIAVVPRRDIKRQGVAVMHHDAIAAEIDPAFVEIAADRNIERPQVAPAVTLMPVRRRQG